MAYVACAIQLMDGAMNLILTVSVTILSFLNTDINVHNAMRYSQIVKSVNFKRIFKIKIDFSQKKLENMKKNLNFYHVKNQRKAIIFTKKWQDIMMKIKNNRKWLRKKINNNAIKNAKLNSIMGKTAGANNVRKDIRDNTLDFQTMKRSFTNVNELNCYY